jgi:hypothetical protein
MGMMLAFRILKEIGDGLCGSIGPEGSTLTRGKNTTSPPTIVQNARNPASTLPKTVGRFLGSGGGGGDGGGPFRWRRGLRDFDIDVSVPCD